MAALEQVEVPRVRQGVGVEAGGGICDKEIKGMNKILIPEKKLDLDQIDGGN